MADDQWAAFKPEGEAAAPADAGRTAPAVAPKNDEWAAFQPQTDYGDLGTIPQTFTERLKNGTAVGNLMEKEPSWKDKAGNTLSALWSAAKEGHAAGYDAEGLAQTWAKNRSDIAAMPDSIYKGALSAAEPIYEGMSNYFHTLNGVIMGGAAAAGQATSMAMGENEADQARARRDFAQMAMVGSLALAPELGGPAAPAIVTKGGEFARMEHDPATGKTEAQVVGSMPTPQDFAAAAEHVSPGNPVTEAKIYQMWKDKGLHPAEVVDMAKRDPMTAHDLSSAAAVPDDLPATDPNIPSQPPGRIAAVARGLTDKLFDAGDAISMASKPMAQGPVEARAMAKDFANVGRRIQWQLNNRLAEADTRWSAAEREQMHRAMDEESIMRQQSVDPKEYEGQYGLSTLPDDMKEYVGQVMERDAANWALAQDVGLVSPDAAGIPVYAARLAEGLEKIEGLRGKGGLTTGGPVPINALGINLRTATSRLKGRKYLTIEETEEALRAKVGDTLAKQGKSVAQIEKALEKVRISRDIKANIVGSYQLEHAINGRMLVNSIKNFTSKYGVDMVAEGHNPGPDWFTIDHPALKTWRPKLEKTESGWASVKDEAGNTIMEQVPIYINKELEGPLRAVLTEKPSRVVNALMEGKSKVMSVIMYSPMIHNGVIASKALEGMKGNVFKLGQLYFTGNKLRKDPTFMSEMIDGGMVPIGKRFFKQDLTDMLTDHPLAPGDSLTAKIAAAIPDLYDPKAGDAVRRAVDKMGDFWHNTLLWDRVADLQAGIGQHFRDEFMAAGIDKQTATRMAADQANMLAGSLPQESMSAAARNIGNSVFFSRTFTMGNLGIMVRAFGDLPAQVMNPLLKMLGVERRIPEMGGLPSEILAQIERDSGHQVAMDAKALAKRKALSTVVTSLVMYYGINSVLQSSLNVILGRNDLSDEMKGYWTRLQKQMSMAASAPWSLATPWGMHNFIQGLSSTAQNPEGKQDRVLLGFEKDGTAIYVKSPLGRIGEEFSEYAQGYWLDMFNRKLGTFARPVMQVLNNDAGFGRQIYDKSDHSIEGVMHSAAQIAWHFAKSQTPATQFEAAANVISGNGTRKDVAATIGPFLPPPFTVTASKGAPGGPAMEQYFNDKRATEFRQQQGMPAIRQMLQRGDIGGAREEMTRLKFDPRYQNWLIKNTRNPAARVNSRTLQQFYRLQDPEARERFNELREQQP